MSPLKNELYLPDSGDVPLELFLTDTCHRSISCPLFVTLILLVAYSPGFTAPKSILAGSTSILGSTSREANSNLMKTVLVPPFDANFNASL